MASTMSDPDIVYLGTNLNRAAQASPVARVRGADGGRGNSDMEHRCLDFLVLCTQEAYLPRARDAFEAFAIALRERQHRPLTNEELVVCAWCAHAAQCVSLTSLLLLPNHSRVHKKMSTNIEQSGHTSGTLAPPPEPSNTLAPSRVCALYPSPASSLQCAHTSTSHLNYRLHRPRHHSLVRDAQKRALNVCCFVRQETQRSANVLYAP